MRWEGRLRCMSTNKSCVGAQCLRSVERSKHKTKGRYKPGLRALAGMSINPRLAEFLLRELEGFPDESDDSVIGNEDDSGAVQLGTLAVTMCSIIEAALRERIQGGHEACAVKASEESWPDVEPSSESDTESEDWSSVDEDYDV